MKAVPISKLRKGQLIRMIEVMGAARDELLKMPEAEVKRGRLGPRPIPTTFVELEGERIEIPLHPKERKK